MRKKSKTSPGSARGDRPRRSARAASVLAAAPSAQPAETAADEGAPVAIRPAREADLTAVSALDERNTGVAKPNYWRDLHARYAQAGRPRFFLVAEDADGAIGGFTIGEVRAWEFGSEPCGWVFAIQVRPELRMHRVGSRLLEALAGKFREAGVGKLRTMLRRDDSLIMSFFRSQGMMAGPFIQLEKDIDEASAASDRTGRP